MILSDRSIKECVQAGRIVITPYDEMLVQPASVDVRLDSRFLVFRNYKYTCIDPKAVQEDLTEMIEVPVGEPFIVHPGEFILGSTLERVGLAGDIAAQLGGKSSLGRLGLIVHATAGFIDPGFEGNVTLELSNVANLPIRLYPSMKVGQISFFRHDHARRPALRPPGARQQVQRPGPAHGQPNAPEFYRNEH